jgi:hypothetical protein
MKYSTKEQMNNLPFDMSAKRRHSFTLQSKLIEAIEEKRREHAMPTPSRNTQFMAAERALAASDPTPLPSRMAFVVRIPLK